MLDNYDYSSIMHYGRNAFSMTGLPTIIPLSGPPAFLGQRWNLSVSDIAKVNKLYKCSQVAAQPEVVPEEAIKEKVMDFIPVHPEPCSKSNLASTVVRKTTEPILSSRKTVGEDLSTVAGYISLKPSSHLSKQRAVLISPVVYGTRCLQFWYRSPDCAAGKINFYTKLLNSTDWQKVRSMKGKQDVGWHQVTLSISTTWTLQVALEGIVGNKLRLPASPLPPTQDPVVSASRSWLREMRRSPFCTVCAAPLPSFALHHLLAPSIIASQGGVGVSVLLLCFCSPSQELHNCLTSRVAHSAWRRKKRERGGETALPPPQLLSKGAGSLARHSQGAEEAPRRVEHASPNFCPREAAAAAAAASAGEKVQGPCGAVSCPSARGAKRKGASGREQVPAPQFLSPWPSAPPLPLDPVQMEASEGWPSRRP
ncbi:MAM and LDL-receptor class A domain-containing protein 1-like [Crotalus adamanteus]|uniref:Metalloendopeptidase n=1 Tax=Crotalus adamanteus TaxID=8729 RepID=A0AAW1B0N9_CROAD